MTDPITYQYTLPGNLDGLTAAVIAFVFGVLVAGGLIVFAWTSARRARYRAFVAEHRVADETKPLEEGFTILRGEVETDSDGSPVMVRLHQIGRDWQAKNGWSTTWTERSREVEARPFYIRLSSEERVRVEPDHRTQIIDILGRIDRVNRTTRIRVSEISAGEKVCVAGVLGHGFNPRAGKGGYREAEGGLILRAPQNERLLISVEPLGERDRRFARLHSKFAAYFAIAFVAINGLLFGNYYLVLALGHTYDGLCVNARQYDTTNKGHTTTHDMVTIRYADGREVEEEAGFQLYSPTHDSPGNVHVPIVAVPAWPARYEVEEATFAFWRGLIALMEIPLSMVIYWLVLSQARPWYEQKRLTETVSGRLDDT